MTSRLHVLFSGGMASRCLLASPFRASRLNSRVCRPYLPPHGSLLVAKRGLDYLGVVGLKRLSVGIAEIKRLYVVPEARGRGIGRMLLARIIDDARLKGYERVRLDSHRPSMSTAIAMYQSLGFVEIPPYGPDLGGEIAFFEKSLDDSSSK